MKKFIKKIKLKPITLFTKKERIILELFVFDILLASFGLLDCTVPILILIWSLVFGPDNIKKFKLMGVKI